MNDRYGHRWLSDAAEDLIVEVQRAGAEAVHCDVLVIGSGYGGAVAAARLAGARTDDESARPISVWLLERGREYLPGMFPATFAELPGHVRFSSGGPARGRRDGLFDLRLSKEMSALLGNGLGGGSLINAAVMERPTDDAFAEHWPAGMNLASLAPAYVRAEAMLAPQTIPESVPKLASLLATAAAMGATESRYASVAITFKPGITPAGVPMQACLRCGDCVSGCNHLAKQSLDVNYLAAARAKGVRLFCGGTVTRLARRTDAPGYRVEFVLTDPAKARSDRKQPYHLNARQVIVAAGTFGSTELLMKSASALGLAAGALGSRFSGNGDQIAVAYRQHERAPCSAKEGDAPARREIGPTITGLARVPRMGKDGPLRPIVVEEFAIPAPLRRLLGEVVTTADALQGLARTERSVHKDHEAIDDPLAVSDEALDHTPVYGLMGDDGALGKLVEVTPTDDEDGGEGGDRELTDGYVRVDWSERKSLQMLFADGLAALRRAHESPGGRGGHVLASPLWQPLPPFEALAPLGDLAHGPALTVHPLGGCPIGPDKTLGVVDRYGRPYAAAGANGETLPGLAVLDGSIVPASLGINPALTIAALAEHALPKLATDWGLALDTAAAPPPPARPRRREQEVLQPSAPAATLLRLRERMSGRLHFGADEIECAALVTFAPFDAAGFRRLPREVALEEVTLEFALAGGKTRARCAGHARVLRREASTYAERVLRARDLVRQRLTDWGLDMGACGPLDLQALASHVGQVRLIEYHWTVTSADAAAPVRLGERFVLTKRIEFTERGNPWRQLSEGDLVRLGNPSRPLGRLVLDLGFLARQMTALVDIRSQQDAPNAIADIAELALWLLRIVLRVHLLNFLPTIEVLTADLELALAGEVAGADPPQYVELPIHAGSAYKLRLARYTPASRTQARPVLLIHGYGAAGSTFTHKDIGEKNLAQALLESGREVWVLDLRTSIGLKQKRHWPFDEVAQGDIPLALKIIIEAQSQPGTRVDIVAHCIGAAMFSVAALGSDLIATQVGSVVLSQVGPLVRMSPFNQLRGFVASYLQQYLQAQVFDLQAEQSVGNLLLDALLATFPYPDDDGEAERQKAIEVKFVTTRHRADAIFGQLMKLSNVSDALLTQLDTIYGWVMVKTLAQTIHYARERLLTDAAGMNQVVAHEQIASRFGFPVMLLHGRENAVFDWRGSEDSVRLLARIFQGHGKSDPVPTTGRRRLVVIEGYGHQDCLVGHQAHLDVYPKIVGFLNEFAAAVPDMSKSSPPVTAELPWMGPTLGAVAIEPPVSAQAALLRCRLAVRPPPARADAFAVVYVPARRLARGGWELIFDEAVAADTDRRTLTEQALVVALRAGELPRYGGFAVITMHDDLPVIEKKRIVNASGQPQGLFAEPAFAPAADVADEARRCLTRAGAEALDRAIVELHEAWITAAAGQPPRDALSVVLSSCQYPAGIVDGVPAARSFTRLADRVAALPTADKPQCLLLLGDQVYVDDLAGLFNPSGTDDIERAYRTNFTLDAFQRVGKALPVLPLIDDHEIGDNWEPGSTDPTEALRGWRQFQYKLVADSGRPPFDTFEVMGQPLAPAGVPIFMLDTRTQREARRLRPAAGAAPLDDATIHNALSLERLRRWLRDAPADRPKLIATSVTVFPFARAALAGSAERIALDDWGGYPHSLHGVLALIAEMRAHQVVLLSGDRHLSSVSSLWLKTGGEPLEVVSVVASGSYAPWPFANQRPEDLWLDGPFEFVHKSGVIAGEMITPACGTRDGFALLSLQRDAAIDVWHLRVELDLADRRWVCRRALGEASRQWQTHVDR